MGIRDGERVELVVDGAWFEKVPWSRRGYLEKVSYADRAGATVRATRSFLEEKLKPIGARPGYSIASLFLPWHPIPAPLFDGFRSLPAT